MTFGMQAKKLSGSSLPCDVTFIFFHLLHKLASDVSVQESSGSERRESRVGWCPSSSVKAVLASRRLQRASTETCSHVAPSAADQISAYDCSTNCSEGFRLQSTGFPPHDKRSSIQRQVTMGVSNQDTAIISAASEARTETDLSTENWHQA